ncbi:MAG: AAC(3) family N-acetyltransferase [Clostridia bacterium]|nr:AAC(3) family N-acetyltransferase [Clostridia bacterium]
MLKKAEVLKQLAQFSKARGKVVTVHTSLKAVGAIEGGGETLLSALIEYFTADGGLLCIPTHTWESDIYDLRKAESCLGVLPCLAAAHPDALRTMHPTHSMAVFGDTEGAQEFAKNDEFANSPADPAGCYGKLYEQDGYVLLIGVGQEKNTFIHCIEEMLGVADRLTEQKVEKTIMHKDGTEEKRSLYWFADTLPDVSEKFQKFEAPFRHFGCIQDGILGNAPVQMCSARKMKEVLELIYTNNKGGELLADDLPVDEKLYLK